MINFRIALTVAGVVMPLLSAPAHAYDDRVLRYGDTSPWSYDGRDDKRDFPTNGFFPGNFVTDPPSAWIGAGGFLSSNPQRSTLPYPSQVVFGFLRRKPSIVPGDRRLPRQSRQGKAAVPVARHPEP
jgi:hypothetical protein